MLQVGLIITNAAVCLKIKTLEMQRQKFPELACMLNMELRLVCYKRGDSFKDILAPNLPRKEPEDVVQGDEKRIELLEKFNFHWKD